MKKVLTKGFWKQPLSLVVLFVVVFYAMTFAVYYFYGPGPEERAEKENNATRQQEMAVTAGEQKATVTVTVDPSLTQQNVGTQEDTNASAITEEKSIDVVEITQESQETNR